MDNTSALVDPDNEFQPDVMLRRLSGGTSQATEQDYVEGPPELVAEVAHSSASYDLHEKFRVYRRAGVSEYLVWRVQDEAIDWWALEDEVCVPLKVDRAGVVRSRVFPGLWLARKAPLAGDMAAVLRALQEGLASPEHVAFVSSLTVG